VAKKVVWTQTAWTDLETIADFISRDSPYYAAAFVREMRDSARSLSLMAMRGRVVPEIGDKQIRELIIQPAHLQSREITRRSPRYYSRRQRSQNSLGEKGAVVYCVRLT
jgi:plasmid stabilization system protein ParE